MITSFPVEGRRQNEEHECGGRLRIKTATDNCLLWWTVKRKCNNCGIEDAQKILAGIQRWKNPGRSKDEKGEEQEAARRAENEVINAILTANEIESTTRCSVPTTAEQMKNLPRRRCS